MINGLHAPISDYERGKFDRELEDITAFYVRCGGYSCASCLEREVLRDSYNVRNFYELLKDDKVNLMDFLYDVTEIVHDGSVQYNTDGHFFDDGIYCTYCDGELLAPAEEED